MAPKSWQVLLDYLTSKAQCDGTLKELNTHTKEEDILQLLWTKSFYRNSLLDWMSDILSSVHQKSESKASEFRVLGNERFRNRDNKGSLSLYNECIRYAPHTSAELSLGLANRSASLFHLELYTESLQDINIALVKGYPIPLRCKLRLRQSNCLIKLGKLHEAVDVLGVARAEVEQIETTGASKIKQESLYTELDRVLADALQRLNVDDSSGIVSEVEALALAYGESPVFTHASAALELKNSEQQGRHVVATRNVAMGDVLFVEKPYALVVLPEQYGKHCHHCTKACINSVPCAHCTDALYCSEECSLESWTEYHQWECLGLELCHSIGIAHLGLRVVLKSSPLSKLEGTMKTLLACGEMRATYRSDEDIYTAVYHLMPHLNNMENEDLFQYALTAFLLALYLAKYTNYYNESSPFDQSCKTNVSADCEHSETILFVGGLILRHIAQLVCNGHAITKLEKPDSVDSVVTETQVRIATAIYPSASMMNHSCDPNIINSFNNQCLIVRASKDVPRGAQVFNCYGPHYRRMGFQERQDVLSRQYFFKCTCTACSRPIEYDFQERFDALLCVKCGGPLVRSRSANSNPHQMICIDCNKSQGVSHLVEESFKASDLFNNGCEDLETGNVNDALHKFQTCLQLRKNCLYRSNQDVTACSDQIARCHATLGNYEEAIKSLLRCIPSVEEQFGEHSIEVANELQKLSDVMLCDLQQEEPESASYKVKHQALKKCVDRAYQIMTTCYGTWNSGLQELIAKKQHLKETAPKETSHIPLLSLAPSGSKG